MTSNTKSWVKNRGRVPVPESDQDDPRIVAIEKRQRDLHERGLPTTFPPEVSGSQTVTPPDLYVRMVAKEAVAWGIKSLRRLSQEVADHLGIPRQVAEDRIRVQARLLEEKAKGGKP